MAALPACSSQPEGRKAPMNELLFWMSAKRSGSAQAFRSKAAELGTTRAGGSLRRTAEWNLAKLGHAEFAPAAGDDAWRVAPPVIAAGSVSADQCRGVLCGARTPRLLARLAHAAGPERINIRPQDWGPDIVEVSAATARELEGMGDAAGIGVQWNAPLAVLCCATPPKRATLQPVTLPAGGWTVAQFSKSGLDWRPSTLRIASEAQSGLFRFRSDYGTVHLIIKDGRPWSCDPAVGKYRILRPRNRVLSYSAADKLLSIVASCRPPELVERALVLCSGALPAFRDGRISYPRVGREVVQAAAAVLGQRFTE